MTQLGMILGTAAYMSPEQAKGRPADKRSDVWAFGCVLYEMLTGRRVFEGEDVSDTLAAVLRADPDWTALDHDVPAAIRTLVKRCLEKDRRKRIGDMSAVRFVLDEHPALSAAGASSAPELDAAAIQTRVDAAVAAARAQAMRRRAWPMAAAGLLLGSLVGLGSWALSPAAAAPDVVRLSFNLNLPESALFGGRTRKMLAISPNGTLVTYIANGELFVRPLGSTVATSIVAPDHLPTSPTFSPDGRSIAFHSFGDSTLKRVSVTGGAPVTLCASGTNPIGLRWHESGLVFARAREIVRCPPNGGEIEVLLTLDEGQQALWPQILPDGDTLLFGEGPPGATGNLARLYGDARIVVQSLSTGEKHVLVEGGQDPQHASSGHVLYANGGSLFAVPLAQRIAGQAEAVPVVEGVRRTSVGLAAAQYSVSATGTLVYLPGPAGADAGFGLAIVDGDRNPARLQGYSGTPAHPRVSRDGRRVAFELNSGQQAEVWVADIAGAGAPRRLTFGGGKYPVLSPDGSRVAYQAGREGEAGVFWRPWGGGDSTRLTRVESGSQHIPEAFSPDGRYLLFAEQKGNSFALFSLSIVDGTVVPFGDVRSAEPIQAVFSADGRFVAYGSNPVSGGGRSQDRGVFVQPFPPTGELHQAPKTALDFHPVWSRTGLTLFYVPTAGAGQLASLSVATTPGVTFGQPVLMPSATLQRISSSFRDYDILPDGRTVGIVPTAVDAGGADAREIRVVLNWFEELKRLVPVD